MRVFVTGGTGLIGSRIVRRLRQRGDAVVVLSRRSDAWKQLGGDCTILQGDPTQAGPWTQALAQCDACVHLAGENIAAGRWTDEFKTRLRESRLRSTDLVARTLAAAPLVNTEQPRVLVSASAIGYYGHGERECDEMSAPGEGFLSQLCQEWESATQPASAAGVRTALIRVGIVLDRNGGALAKLLPPFRLGLGGPAGSGQQWMSWVHHDDLVGLFLKALDTPTMSGPYNGTAPNPVRNSEFSKALAAALHRPAFLKAPAFALRLMMGESAQLALDGQRVLPRRVLESGFSYRFPELAAALADLVSSGSPTA